MTTSAMHPATTRDACARWPGLLRESPGIVGVVKSTDVVIAMLPSHAGGAVPGVAPWTVWKHEVWPMDCGKCSDGLTKGSGG